MQYNHVSHIPLYSQACSAHTQGEGIIQGMFRGGQPRILSAVHGMLFHYLRCCIFCPFFLLYPSLRSFIINLESPWLAFKTNFRTHFSIKLQDKSLFPSLYAYSTFSFSRHCLCFCFPRWTVIFSRAWPMSYLSLFPQPQACIKFLINVCWAK